MNRFRFLAVLCGCVGILLSQSEVQAQTVSKRDRSTEAAKTTSETVLDEKTASLQHEIFVMSKRMALLEAALKEKDAAAARAETDRRAAALAQKKELNALSKTVSGVVDEMDALETHPSSGYDAGFFVADTSRKLRLRVNGILRTAYALSIERQFAHDSNGRLRSSTHRDAAKKLVLESGFRVLRGGLTAHAMLGEMVQTRFQIDYGRAPDAPIYSKQFESPRAEGLLGDRSLAPRLRVLDFFAEIKPYPAISFRAGQFKVSFDKEGQYGLGGAPFVEYSLLSRRYRLYGDRPLLDESDLTYRQPYEVARSARFGRDVGAAANVLLLNERLDLSAGVFNGAGVGVENDNRDVLAAFRVDGRVLGSEQSRGVADITGEAPPYLSLGGAFAFDLLEHQSMYLPSKQYNSADFNLTVDVHFKWRGFFALGELFFRHADHGGAIFEVNDSSLDELPVRSLGGMLAVGYFYAPIGLLPAFRYALYDARLDRKKDHVQQITLAISYVLKSRLARLTLEYGTLVPRNSRCSYLAPMGAFVDTRHDMSLLAEVSF